MTGTHVTVAAAASAMSSASSGPVETIAAGIVASSLSTLATIRLRSPDLRCREGLHSASFAPAIAPRHGVIVRRWR